MELISREEVLKHLKPLDEEETDGIFVSIAKDILQQAYDVVEKLPTIESRPKGVWLGISYDGYADGNPVYTEWECSNCGLEINDDNGEILWNYCPDCGAEMRGEE